MSRASSVPSNPTDLLGQRCGTSLSLGFGAFPATPPPQTVALTAHSRQVRRVDLTAFPGLPIFASPGGTCLSLGFGAFPVAPPAQGVVLSPHPDRLTELALRLSQGCPFGFLR